MTRGLILGSFAVFLALFVGIGALAARRAKGSSEDYLVASRSVSPWLVALSAVSTNNSGYVFIGLIGFTWRAGLQAAWITLGWILGDLLTWFWVHRRVRQQSEARGVTSVPALLATGGDGRTSRPIAIAAGLLTFVFLGAYAAAQLRAGSAALTALFDWPGWVGAVVGVAIVTIYCLAGGIRASIWTDAAQSIVMLGAMSLLMVVCVQQVGGPSALWAQLEAIDPALVQWMPEGLAFGVLLYVVGFVFGGMATIGQPHILVRFMAIDATRSIRRARNIYFVWYLYFSAAALLVGLYSRVLLPDLAAGLEGMAVISATEAALPTLSVALLPPVLIGLMLAGLFSATMSTADSQILSCSAALTQDVAPRYATSYTASKVATLAVAGVALLIALSAESGVLPIVLVAWSGLGATLGPVLLVRLAGRPLSSGVALTMMAVGLGTVIAWGQTAWSNSLFTAMPGMLAALAVYGVSRALRPRSS